MPAVAGGTCGFTTCTPTGLLQTVLVLLAVAGESGGTLIVVTSISDLGIPTSVSRATRELADGHFMSPWVRGEVLNLWAGHRNHIASTRPPRAPCDLVSGEEAEDGSRQQQGGRAGQRTAPFLCKVARPLHAVMVARPLHAVMVAIKQQINQSTTVSCIRE